jgi:hypothetical protein
MSAKIFVIFMLLILIGAGGLLITKASPLKSIALPELNFDIAKITQHLLSNVEDSNAPKPTLSPTTAPSTTPLISPKTTTKPSSTPPSTIKPTAKPAPKKPIPTPNKECYRFENKCYSKSDYNQLLDLSFDLSSAKTFYQFHMDGITRYEEEYKKTGSSIYLDAKSSQQSKAEGEKAKIDKINSEMYNIKLRGY